MAVVAAAGTVAGGLPAAVVVAAATLGGGAAAVTAPEVGGAVLPVPAEALGTGRRGRSFLDGEIDAPGLVDVDDLDLYGLPLGEKVADVLHIGMGDLRDVDQTGAAPGQGDERAELGDTFDGSFQNCAYTDFHKWCVSSS